MNESADELKDVIEDKQPEPEVELSDEVESPIETDADEQLAQTEEESDAETADSGEDAGEEVSAEAHEQNPVPEAEEHEADGPSTADFVIVSIFAVILGMLLCLPTLLGSSSGAHGEYDLSGGVATTINGVEIGENDVTAFITAFRTTQGFESDDAWGQWLVDNSYTPETLRLDVIEYLTTNELFAQAAEEQGVEVSEADIDAQVSGIIEQVGGEEAFHEVLAMQGISEESYRENIATVLLQEKLIDKVTADDEMLSDDVVLEMMKAYFPDEVPADAESLEGLDPALVDSMRSWLKQQAFSGWMDQYRQGSDITVNDMPENLPYDIDISGYEMTAGNPAELMEYSEPIDEPQDDEGTGE